MEQTQNISDERLKELFEAHRECAPRECSLNEEISSAEAISMVGELRQARRDLATYRNAPCPFEQENEALRASHKRLVEALESVQPYMEAAEKAGLVGDEGCHWPVEIVHAALAEARKLEGK